MTAAMRGDSGEPGIQAAKIQADLFKSAWLRERWSRLLYPTQTNRHRALMTWSIAQGAIRSPEKPVQDQILLNLSQTSQLAGTCTLSGDKIIALRQQALGLSMALPAIYPSIPIRNTGWAKQFVSLPQDQADKLKRIIQEGGLILTAHTFFHNLLGAVIGMMGGQVIGIAAPLGQGPDWPVLGPVISAINQGSERHFGGGRYLYTDNPRELARGLESAQSNNQIVVGLLDHGDPRSKHKQNLLGWSIGLQDALVSRWVRSNQTIAFATLRPTISTHELKLLPNWQLDLQVIKQPEDRQAVDAILEKYVGCLTEFILQNPWAWQGFRWVHAFGRSQTDAKQHRQMG